MKKLFLFVAVATLGLTTSCSSDDNSGGGASGNSELKVTIDGVAKTFNTIVVDKDTYTEEGESWTELTVTATIDNNPSEMFVFYVEQGDTEAFAIWNFYYTKDGSQYWNNGQLSSVVQTNSSNNLKGTFSGKITDNSFEETEVNLTNGSFNIFH